MTAAAQPKKRQLWAYVPALILVSLIGTQLLVLRAVLFDPAHSVETDYYQKAVNWDERQAQQRQRVQLGWQLGVRTESKGNRTELEVHLLDREGAELNQLNLSVEAFSNVRSNFRLNQSLEALGGGRYRTQLMPTTKGLWEIRVRVQAEGVDYVESLRRELGEP